jgi:HEAT repeat protein
MRALLLVLTLFGYSCASYCESPRKLAAYAANARKKDLLDCLDAEESWVREETARVLGRVRSPEVVERLHTVLLDANERPWVRAAAADGLAQLARPESFEVMAGVIAAPGLDPEQKLALIEGLCTFSERRADAVQAIAPLVNDEDLMVAALAAKKVTKQCAR